MTRSSVAALAPFGSLSDHVVVKPEPSKGSSCSPGCPAKVTAHPVLADRVRVGEPDQRHRSGAGSVRSSEKPPLVRMPQVGTAVPGASTATSTLRIRCANVPGWPARRSSSVRPKVQRPVRLSCPNASGRSARERVGAGDGHRDPCGTEPDRLELGEVERQPVGAADVAHPRVEVVQPDHPERCRELVGQRALREPRCLPGQVEIAVQRPAGDAGERVPEVAVEEPLVLVVHQVPRVRQVGGRDLALEPGDRDVPLLHAHRGLSRGQRFALQRLQLAVALGGRVGHALAESSCSAPRTRRTHRPRRVRPRRCPARQTESPRLRPRRHRRPRRDPARSPALLELRPV